MEQVCSKAPWHHKRVLHLLAHSIHSPFSVEDSPSSAGLTNNWLPGGTDILCETGGNSWMCLLIVTLAVFINSLVISSSVEQKMCGRRTPRQLHPRLTYSVMPSVCWFAPALHRHMAHISHFPRWPGWRRLHQGEEGGGMEEFQNQANQTNTLSRSPAPPQLPTAPHPSAYSSIKLALFVCWTELGLESSLPGVNKPEEAKQSMTKKAFQFTFKSEANQLICVVQCGILSSPQRPVTVVAERSSYTAATVFHSWAYLSERCALSECRGYKRTKMMFFLGGAKWDTGESIHAVVVFLLSVDCVNNSQMSSQVVCFAKIRFICQNEFLKWFFISTQAVNETDYGAFFSLLSKLK